MGPGPPGTRHTLQTTKAGSTHSTGMHSCYKYSLFLSENPQYMCGCERYFGLLSSLSNLKVLATELIGNAYEISN